MSKKERKNKLKDNNYWESVKVENFGLIPFIRLQHYCYPLRQILLINFDQIKTVRTKIDDKKRHFIELAIDESLLPLVDDLLRKGVAYNVFDKTLTLAFNTNSETGEYLEKYFSQKTETA